MLSGKGFFEPETHSLKSRDRLKVNMDRCSREKKTIRYMIGLYCRGRHRTGNALCNDCGRLLDYALQRIDRCPYGQNKPLCAKCFIHCSKPVMQERIRRVMRFAGPRMIVLHPLLALLHFMDGFAKKGKAG